MTYLLVRKVKSFTDESKEYVVRKEINRVNQINWSCSCPAFMMRNPSRSDCKHIAQVKNKITIKKFEEGVSK